MTEVELATCDLVSSRGPSARGAWIARSPADWTAIGPVVEFFSSRIASLRVDCDLSRPTQHATTATMPTTARSIKRLVMRGSFPNDVRHRCFCSSLIRPSFLKPFRMKPAFVPHNLFSCYRLRALSVQRDIALRAGSFSTAYIKASLAAKERGSFSRRGVVPDTAASVEELRCFQSHWPPMPAASARRPRSGVSNPPGNHHKQHVVQHEPAIYLARKLATTSISAVCGNISSGVTASRRNVWQSAARSRANVPGLHET